LCAAGELLTSVAILLVLPDIGALLERGPPPERVVPAWTRPVLWWTRSPARAKATLCVACLPLVVVAVTGGPRAGDAVVAIRPEHLAPLDTYATIERLFHNAGDEWIVMVSDKDAETAKARADRVVEALDPLVLDGTIAHYDALTRMAPAR